MQYMVYRNKGNSKAYPYLLDVQSDIIDELHTRMVIPLFPVSRLVNNPVKRLTPTLNVEGNDYLVMTHEMASIRLSQIGDEVMDVRSHRQTIKNALDLSLTGSEWLAGQMESCSPFWRGLDALEPVEEDEA
ncbi:cytotoxic protein CcdB [Salmonella enterica subsp. enterica]|nr:cytotoxic protein CcdB [Salmonella enterica subsp. enterica]